MSKSTYPNIDMKRTGSLLKYKITQAGYSVKNIQNYLKLSCPQPIYRWYAGKVLPSVDHLFALSRLLDVHMDELIVSNDVPFEITSLNFTLHSKKRLYLYWIRLSKVA